MNDELRSLFDPDQDVHREPRIAGAVDYDSMRSRDSQRRERVREIIAEADTMSAVDLYHAAWILNHGDEAEEAKVAFELAEKSFDGGHEPAAWLFAAAFDRWCMYCGRPQKYGTQIVPDGVRYRVWDTDPDTTDQERRRFNVPPIAEMHARAASESKTMAQSPMEFAPKWLLDAVERWSNEFDEE